MRFRLPFTPRAWMLTLLGAVALLAWLDARRIERALAVSAVEVPAGIAEASSPTGYADGKRWFIVPEHDTHSYQWIAETQQMFARGEWRVRRVDDENAPFGREVNTASPLRWWLGGLAWCDHLLSGRPLGQSVERAALYAGPLLHLLLLIGTTLFVAKRFGPAPAALFPLGLAACFPLATAFLPGVPDDFGLALVGVIWSVLPLVAALDPAPAPRAGTNPPPRRRTTACWFFVAGAAGGCGLWVDAATEAPVLLGIAVTGMIIAVVVRFARSPLEDGTPPLPWRAWSLGGATISLLAYLIEFAPAHLETRLEVNHPLFGVAWLGAGELLTLLATWRPRGSFPGSRRRLVAFGAAVLALAALPVAVVWRGAATFLPADPLASQLTLISGGTVAKNFAAWAVREGASVALGATLLPLFLLIAPALLLRRRRTGAARRTALALGFGPALAAAALAFHALRWWGVFDALLLVVLLPTVAALGVPPVLRRTRIAFFAAGAAALLVGLGPPLQHAKAFVPGVFTRVELEGLLDREAAHWLADHTGPPGAVILAPPDSSTSLCFFGGLRGLGSPNWENRDGVAASIQIVCATTVDEAQALLNRRTVTHLVLPSWDTDLDDFTRWTMTRPENSFLAAIHRWAIPPWLRPLPYPLPALPGFENQSLLILRVTDESDRATALCRTAEYFLEMQQMDGAVAAADALLPYPTKLAALVARAEVEQARGHTAGFGKLCETVVSSLAAGLDRGLPWDRRVSLAVVLALDQKTELARAQVRRCLAEATADRLRSLSTGSLYRLQALAQTFDLPFADPRLQALGRALLPAELRRRL